MHAQYICDLLICFGSKQIYAFAKTMAKELLLLFDNEQLCFYPVKIPKSIILIIKIMDRASITHLYAELCTI